MLDEPNSNLDEAGEKALSSALAEMKALGSTILSFLIALIFASNRFLVGYGWRIRKRFWADHRGFFYSPQHIASAIATREWRIRHLRSQVANRPSLRLLRYRHVGGTEVKDVDSDLRLEQTDDSSQTLPGDYRQNDRGCDV